MENQLIIKADENNHLRVCLPNGEFIGGEIFVRVHEEVGCLTTAIIKCIVKIETNG